MCTSWAVTPTCCLTSDGPVRQEAWHQTPPPIDSLQWTLTDSPAGQRLISFPRAGRDHKEKKLASSARGSLCWIIVLLQHWDLGLLRKVFGKRMKKNKAWIFRHPENVAKKSLKKNNAFWRLKRALLLLSTLKCDCCHLVFHTVASTFKEERDLANHYQFPRSWLGFRKLRISLKSLCSELL